MQSNIKLWNVSTAFKKGYYAAQIISTGEYDWEKKMGKVYAESDNLDGLIKTMKSKGYDYHPVDGFIKAEA